MNYPTSRMFLWTDKKKSLQWHKSSSQSIRICISGLISCQHNLPSSYFELSMLLSSSDLFSKTFKPLHILIFLLGNSSFSWIFTYTHPVFVKKKNCDVKRAVTLTVWDRMGMGMGWAKLGLGRYLDTTMRFIYLHSYNL